MKDLVFRVPAPLFHRLSIDVPILPEELLVHIFANLECKDLLRCEECCRRFRRLVKGTSRLKYIIELFKNSLTSVISPYDRSTHASRLKLLQERELNWRMLAWKRRCGVDLPPAGTLYEFVGGMYAKGRETDNKVTSSISFLELPSTGIPSADRGDAMLSGLRTWSHCDLLPDMWIIDFTMDPVQDLLVLVLVTPPDTPHLYEVHIRSLKTNQPHPDAPVAVFPCLPQNSVPPMVVESASPLRVQVCGDLIALLIRDIFDHRGGYFELWNWRHGPSRSCRLPHTHNVDDFTFLGRDACLIVRSSRFEVCDIVDPKIRSSEATLRYSFAFPKLKPGFRLWYIALSSNPTPGCVPSSQDLTTMEGFLAGHPQMHYPTPDNRVHACALYVINPSDPALLVQSFVLFVRMDTFTNPSYEWFNQEDDLPYYNWKQWVKRRRADNLPLARLPRKSPLRSDSPPLADLDLPLHGFPAESSSTPYITTHPLPLPTVDVSALPAGTFPSHLTEEELSTFVYDGTFEGQVEAPFFDPANSSASIPWSVWGNQSTRWFDEQLNTDWQHAVHGSRAGDLVSADKAIEERKFDILSWPPKSTTTTTASSSSSSSTQGEESPKDPSSAMAVDTPDSDPRRSQRFLRVRDFGTYSLTRTALTTGTADHPVLAGKGKIKQSWRMPRVVSLPSQANTDEIFAEGVVGSLPYVETLTDETFDATDVMMDDSRILLLKRETTGKIGSMEVLLM